MARVHVAAWRAAYAGLVPEAEIASRDVPARTALWTALLEGRPVDGEPLPTAIRVLDDAELGVRGFLTLHVPARDPDVEAGVAEVAALYVHPERWRDGAGRALLADARRVAAASGAHATVLWVLTGNAAARAFYVAQGFAPDGLVRAHVGVEELRLRSGTL